MTPTPDQDLAFAGPSVLAEMVRSRQVSPRELVEHSLRRIDALNPQLNAFRVTLAEEAIAAAEAMGDPQGPLAGVPVAIKDDQPVARQPTTYGSRSYGPPAAADAEVVRRLRAAGAIPIGITNVPELMIFPWTATTANGITRNPWNRDRTPGGSSGGSAAAVASAMVPVATASDGGGSIRIPAACCGLVGLKASRGRISLAPYTEAWLGLSTFGALTRTVADSALLLDVLRDPDGLPAPEASYAEAARQAPRRLRIAISRKIPTGLIARISPDQRLAFDRTARLLSELGHDVVERHPRYGTIALHFLATWTRGVHEDSLKVPDRSQLEASTRQMAAAGRLITPDSRRAGLLARRAGHTARMLELWDDFDVLLTPGLASTAIAAEGGYGKPAPVAFDRAGRFTPWTAPFNVTGQPAVTIPAGLGADSLPLSVQLVGRPADEGTLISLAAELERAQPWAPMRPPIT